MKIDEESNNLDQRIASALDKYEKSHERLGEAAKALAQQVVILVERAGGRSAAASASNIKETTLDNYRSGVTQPKILDLLALSIAAKVPFSDFAAELDRLSEFGAGDIDLSVPTLAHRTVAAISAEEHVAVPLYSVHAAAGAGILPTDENEAPEQIHLTRSFIRRLGANPEHCHLIASRGDSMLPTIPNGSLMLVDRSKTDFDDDAVLVFRVGEGIKVKRVRWRLDAKLDLVSDNQVAGYPPETYERHELNNVVPLGRVMCIMRGM